MCIRYHNIWCIYVHQRVSIASLAPSGVATVADATAALAGHSVAGTNHLHEQFLVVQGGDPQI